MTFPTIPTTAAGRLSGINQLNTTATLTGPDLNTLTARAAGDLVIACAGMYQSNAGADAAFTGWAGGGLTWTEIRDSTGTANGRLGVAYARLVTGSETGAVTVTRSGTLVGDASMILMTIPGAHDTTAPEASAAVHASNAAADPASFDPAGWAAEDTLWIGVNGNGLTSGTGSWTANNSAPTNYTDFFGTSPTDTSTIGDFGLAVAFRQLNAASEDMGGFGQDTSNARSSALIIAVRPAAAAPITSGEYEFSLTNPVTTPPNNDEHSTTIRAWATAGSGSLLVRLMQGTTEIDSWSHTLTGSAANYNHPVASAAAANITDYTDLRLEMKSQGLTGLTVRVSQAFMTLPEGPEPILQAVDPATLTLQGQDVVAAGTGSASVTVDVAVLTLQGQDVVAATSGGEITQPVDPAILTLTGVDVVAAGTGDASVAVDAATLTLQGQDVVATGSGAASVAVDPATLTLQGQTPTAAGTGAASVAVDPATLTLQGQTPAAAGTGVASVAVDPATLTLQGQTPVAAGSGVASVTVDVAVLTLQGQDVVAAGTGVASVAIDTAILTLVGVDVSIAGGPINQAVDPAILTLQGQDVVAAGTGVASVTVDVAILTLLGVDLVAAGTGAAEIAVDPAILSLQGQTPVASGSGVASVAIDPAILLLQGQEVTAAITPDVLFNMMLVALAPVFARPALLAHIFRTRDPGDPIFVARDADDPRFRSRSTVAEFRLRDPDDPRFRTRVAGSPDTEDNTVTLTFRSRTPGPPTL